MEANPGKSNQMQWLIPGLVMDIDLLDPPDLF